MKRVNSQAIPVPFHFPLHIGGIIKKADCEKALNKFRVKEDGRQDSIMRGLVQRIPKTELCSV
jgi:hypothetical protein